MEEPSALDVFVERDASGAWAMTPLSKSVTLTLRPPAPDGCPPVGARGVIWRLDDQVFASYGTGSNFAAKVADLVLEVPKKLKETSDKAQRLSLLASKLEAHLSNFQEEKRVLGEQQTEAERQAAELQDRAEKLDDDRERFNAQVSSAAEGISRAIRAPVRAGDVASQPADVFFVAAQDEFARAIPTLNQNEEGELRHMRLTPEAAFNAAKQAFFGAGTGEAEQGSRVDAMVRALLALQCLEEQQPVRMPKALEQLQAMAQGQARLANNSGHLPLAFAASACAVWCSLRRMDHLSEKWDEAQPEEFLREEVSDIGHLLRTARLLANFSKAAYRMLRAGSEHTDHRRRFMRFMAAKGIKSAADADLRLLFMPRDAAPRELAVHIRRLGALSGLVDQQQVTLAPSRHKRPRVEPIPEW